jgi:hypothetical protein
MFIYIPIGLFEERLFKLITPSGSNKSMNKYIHKYIYYNTISIQIHISIYIPVGLFEERLFKLIIPSGSNISNVKEKSDADI